MALEYVSSSSTVILVARASCRLLLLTKRATLYRTFDRASYILYEETLLHWKENFQALRRWLTTKIFVGSLYLPLSTRLGDKASGAQPFIRVSLEKDKYLGLDARRRRQSFLGSM
jgi:hypothetical protein